ITNNLDHLDTFTPGTPALGPGEVNLHVHVLQGASGAHTLMPDLLRAAKNVLVDDASFDPVRIADTIVGADVTGMCIARPVPPPLLEVIGSGSSFPHRLRRMVIFFATPALLEAVTRSLGPIWCHGFGSTEQGAPATRLAWHEAQENPARLA